MSKLHLDIETYSEANLKTQGLYKYAEHPSTDLNVVCYAFDKDPVYVWAPWESLPDEVVVAILEAMDDEAMLYISVKPPVTLHQHIVAAEQVWAHNAMFERVVLNKVAGTKHSFPEITIDQTRCTMAKCAVHGIPQALKFAAEALDTKRKDEEAINDMRYFAKPRKDGTKPTPDDEPERYIRLVKYCIDDVIAERDLDHNIPDLSEREQEIYRLDQRINHRGVMVDQESIFNVQLLIDEYKTKLVEFCKGITGAGPTQTAALAKWVRANGYPQLKNLQAPTIEVAINDAHCPRTVAGVLKCYSTHNMKAVSKYDAMMRAVCEDGRLHGMFQYYGGAPGRWSSRIVQLQNLFRPVIQDASAAIEAFRTWDLDWVRMLYEGTDAMKVFASCVRGVLVAAPGHDLLSFDFSSIEARIAAWLAGDKAKLRIFETHGKVYEAMAARMYDMPIENVSKDSSERLHGKIAELAGQYGGGAAAIVKKAKEEGAEITEGEAEKIKWGWREANKPIVDLWKKLNDACVAAVANPGKGYGIPGKKIMFKVEGRWLYMRLPSGRRIAYLDPEYIEGDTEFDSGATYMGVNTKTRKWERVFTYGGRLLQNACEGIARDILVNGLFNMEEAGYETTMTVHDEGVFEIEENFNVMGQAGILMTTPMKWAEGLPVKASGWRAKRYRK